MNVGPSQMDLLDPKPELNQRHLARLPHEPALEGRIESYELAGRM